MAPDPGKVLGTIDDLAQPDASLQDKEIAKTLQVALDNVRRGPSAFTRNKRGRVPVPWTPPTHVAFTHPEDGAVFVEVETGNIMATLQIAEVAVPAEPVIEK